VYVKWSKDLETGVSFVDADHKVLINLLNQINACIDQREESTVLGSILDALVEYTDYHFLREEKMMELSDYKGLAGHKDVHRALSDQVRTVYTDYQAEPGSVDPVDVRDFLNSWLIEHIMGHDFSYRSACIDDKVAMQAAGEVSFLSDQGAAAFSDWECIRVMLVDDNANFRTFIRTMLKAVGVRNLQIMGSPSEALSRLSQRPADVVLCDWVMEEMNGSEFAREVQALDLPTRVILLTGFSTDELRERSSDLNIYEYLEKPIKARLLLESIAEAALVLRRPWGQKILRPSL